MKVLQHANFPFVKYRYLFYAIAGVLFLASIVGLLFIGVNWSTDFTGGVTTTINMKPANSGVAPLNIDKLRKVINDGGFKEAEIQYVGNPADATFQIKVAGKDADKFSQQLIQLISEKLTDYTQGRDLQNDVVREKSTVGAKAGSEMRANVTLAVVIALILMIIYIWIRFEVVFGFMAIVALFFNVMVILGIFAFTGKEITMQIIAALLTIVGYSINDTIVVFDRIREDLKVYRKDPVPLIFNRAMNSTLSRTIITGGSTLLCAISLYLWGGAVIHDFSLAITLGIIIGTLSSIFIASNLVLDAFKVTHQEKQAIQHLTKKK